LAATLLKAAALNAPLQLLTVLTTIPMENASFAQLTCSYSEITVPVFALMVTSEKMVFA
jgi:hypothetical protein